MQKPKNGEIRLFSDSDLPCVKYNAKFYNGNWYLVKDPDHPVEIENAKV
jgi:hypothetical protein